jgi:hypothetical protein
MTVSTVPYWAAQNSALMEGRAGGGGCVKSDCYMCIANLAKKLNVSIFKANMGITFQAETI